MEVGVYADTSMSVYVFAPFSVLFKKRRMNTGRLTRRDKQPEEHVINENLAHAHGRLLKAAIH